MLPLLLLTLAQAPDLILYNAKILMADYNSLGITSFTDRAATPSHIDIYRALHKEGQLSCRVFLDYHVTDPNRDWPSVEAELDRAAADPLHKYDNMLWLRGLKVFLDGGTQSGYVSNSQGGPYFPDASSGRKRRG